jgi:hypothetical protein
MNIEEVIKYAKERGLSEKMIALLVASLHPDENGKLSLEESIQVPLAIDYHIATKEHCKRILEQVKSMRAKRNNTDK